MFKIKKFGCEIFFKNIQRKYLERFNLFIIIETLKKFCNGTIKTRAFLGQFPKLQASWVHVAKQLL